MGWLDLVTVNFSSCVSCACFLAYTCFLAWPLVHFSLAIISHYRSFLTMKKTHLTHRKYAPRVTTSHLTFCTCTFRHTFTCTFPLSPPPLSRHAMSADVRCRKLAPTYFISALPAHHKHPNSYLYLYLHLFLFQPQPQRPVPALPTHP